MFKTPRSTFASIFTFGFALYLGYGFSDVFLKPFLPDVLALPAALLAGIGFFLILRWLGAAEVATATAPRKVARPLGRIAGLVAPDQQHVFRVRKSKAPCWKAAGQDVGQASCVR